MAAGFSYDETFVATGENFPDALAGGQLAGGKYYANTTTVVGGNRWSNGTYVNYGIKCASPILLTKDGNRAADSVIAAGLAWNPTKRSVDAYEFINANLLEYLDDYLTPGMISADVYTNDVYGFFTDTLVAAGTGTPTMTRTFNSVDDVERVFAAWVDGYRVVDNNFHGVIFGGKAAVSKDKAKQLDDTVRDSIYTMNDRVAGYDNESYVTVNGKTYRTLGWLTNNVYTWWKNNNLGVNGWGTASGAQPWNDIFSANEVVAVPYGNYGTYNYLYQPYSYNAPVVSYYPSGRINTQSYTIDFARFDSIAVDALSTNSYTGYGLKGKGQLTITYTYADNANQTLIGATGSWTDTNI
jgi:hypothetical protein